MRFSSFVRTALAVLSLSALLIIGVCAASFGQGVVTASTLHLRALPSADSSSLALVPSGTYVEVLSAEKDGWYRVSYQGKSGYMFAEYLNVSPLVSDSESSSTTSSESTPESGIKNGKVTLTSGYLNIRSAPSTKGGKIGIIPNHTVLALEEHVDGWYRITFRGISGYVAERYVVPTDEKVLTDEEAVTALAELAVSFLGTPYVYGASGPDSFDCSGFTSYIYRQAGCFLNRTAAAQFTGNGTAVEYEDLRTGDLVFFRETGSASAATHVGIYLENGEFIHASSSGSTVKYGSLLNSWFASHYVGAKRVI